MRVAPEIVLTEEERAELMKLARSKLTSVRLAQRARIMLLAADGVQNKDIAAQLGIGREQVARWRGRYAQMRLAGIERDLPRGAPPKKVDLARLVELTTQSTPKAATHWSTRTMAVKLGVHGSTVSRNWRAAGLKPHLVRGFKISRDPKFVEKLEDVVGTQGDEVTRGVIVNLHHGVGLMGGPNCPIIVEGLDLGNVPVPPSDDRAKLNHPA